MFHFNPRFEQNCVVRNSYFNGEWGQEEVHATKKNPFKRGQMFIMEIYVMKSEYLVSLDSYKDLIYYITQNFATTVLNKKH